MFLIFSQMSFHLTLDLTLFEILIFQQIGVTPGFLHLIVFPDILSLKLKLQIFVANVNIGPATTHCFSSQIESTEKLASRATDHK